MQIWHWDTESTANNSSILGRSVIPMNSLRLCHKMLPWFHCSELWIELSFFSSCCRLLVILCKLIITVCTNEMLWRRIHRLANDEKLLFFVCYDSNWIHFTVMFDLIMFDLYVFSSFLNSFLKRDSQTHWMNIPKYFEKIGIHYLFFCICIWSRMEIRIF